MPDMQSWFMEMTAVISFTREQFQEVDWKTVRRMGGR